MTMYLMAYTLNHGNNNLEDVWMIYEDRASANEDYKWALDQENLHCAALTKIVDATEPHWTEDVTDGPSDKDT